MYIFLIFYHDFRIFKYIFLILTIKIHFRNVFLRPPRIRAVTFISYICQIYCMGFG